MKDRAEDHIIHFTDLRFIHFCESHFGINRGVYNTIESRFYENGYVDIIKRRHTIIQFLRFSSQNHQRSRKLRFGHGGLARNLDDFLQGILQPGESDSLSSIRTGTT